MAREEQVSVRFSRTIYHRRTMAVNPALETFLTVANADVRISRIRSGGLKTYRFQSRGIFDSIYLPVERELNRNDLLNAEITSTRPVKAIFRVARGFLVF